MTQRQISIEEAIELAAQNAREGKVDAARNLYRRILQSDPGNKAVQHALEQLPAGAAETPFSVDMRRLVGLYNRGDLEQAATEAQRLITAYPGKPMPTNVLGAILLQRGELEQAEAAFNTALSMAPNYVDAWSNLGNAQLAQGNNKDAITSYREALALNPPGGLAALINRGLGKALAEVGELEEARVVLERALEQQPNDPVTRTACAMALRELGELGEAIAHFRAALESDPENALAYLELGLTQRRIQRYDDACNSIQKAIELEPHNAKHHQHLGKLYSIMGETELAAEAYRQSLALDPESAEVQHLLDAAQGTRSAKAPEKYVKEMFDTFSSTFDQRLVDSLEYRTPQVLADMVKAQLGEGTSLPAAIDLGCGTGLLGVQLKGLADHLVGVDLSPKMLEQAAEKGIYQELLSGDLVEVMSASERSFNLVASADVLTYIGDLEPLMAVVAGNIPSGGILAISTELLEDDGDYQLLGSGRYAHNRDYVCNSAANVGLRLLQEQVAPLRKEEGDWITGGYYLFGKS